MKIEVFDTLHRRRSFLRTARWLLGLTLAAAISSALADEMNKSPEGVYEQSKPATVSKSEKKSIFIFLDGTSNDGRQSAESATNIWRLYQIVKEGRDPRASALYVEGVGTTDNPVFGLALGRGMQIRILRGYEFLSRSYQSGDDVYIFGFSRGALEARALAGLVSYVGMLDASGLDHEAFMKVSERMLSLLEHEKDAEYVDQWKAWRPGNKAPFSSRVQQKFGAHTVPADVKLLGVWDTVPGSSFKAYQGCKERIGFWKRNFFWLPMISRGERYKVDSYPAVRGIAHAMARDEKRSKFAPIYACAPVNSDYTTIQEVWFPGAHADVGGGYSDDPEHELPGISLRWMVERLSENYQTLNTTSVLAQIAASSSGLAHWSIGEFPANIGSHCQERQLPAGSTVDDSVKAREHASPVRLRVHGSALSVPYPAVCSSPP